MSEQTTKLIEWRDEFAIGIPSVDFEHRQMIGMINKLHESLAGTPAQDTVSRFLGEIHSLISAHFALEEKEMLEIGYDGFEDHKDDHERLLDEILDLLDEVDNGDAGAVPESLGQRLNIWFTEHFKTRDAKLHRFLDDRGGW